MTITTPDSVTEVRDLLRPALAATVDRLSPEVRAVAAYHLGLTDAEGRPAGPGSGGGKALRPALALLSARAAGAPAQHGVPAALAVELVHNFSLLHDDIMDGDVERRHRPTAWKVFGIGPAVLAGDALLALAQDVLLERDDRHAHQAAHRLSAATLRLITGQGSDLAFERRNDVTSAECLTMAGGKTAALIACASSIGAVSLGAPTDLAAGLAAFGEHAGLAFQLTDDLLSIWGAPDLTGKTARADLRARKRSLPVVAALNSSTAEGRQLHELLTTPDDLTEEDLELAAKLVDQAGGRTWAEEEADRRLAHAQRCLAETDMPDDVRAEFSAIARYLTSRQN
jgi:geranylgeranyl diphosphate synthase type I